MRGKEIYLALLLSALLINNCRVEKTTIENFTPPKLISQPRLLYPKVAQENALWGTTKLILSINKNGEVDDIFIIKSSGHSILDSAALDYCKKLIFSPAKRNDTPINSKIEWVIKFNITEKSWDAETYLYEISQLYQKVELLTSRERIETERVILKKHNEFIQKFGDALNFNKVLSRVISSDIYKEWSRDWDGWPLSFLLYHDFLQRFKDYDSISVVKSLLVNSLKSDIQYIKNTPA